ncbi:transposon Ty3-I Gag-Pol polyprotein [Trichonephila clavata]|uniref:Transposon Ty3-I Gag-Pol polyprotein n=1 Tax=Trichonephila clavata TaxID=2740835 RepID=A0A8X6HKG3_TRICU|nr:transposon Ty3-I Gag-Pol polyprotein [Trichonephila clavata]GFR25621.1 transposon Ty3-I Gag-Pol polyprotein [Trichonephila clavata]
MHYVFSSRFRKIPVEPSDIRKTVICTSSGLYELTRMTYGLCKAAQTFMRFLHSVLRGLDFCLRYIDHILVALKNEAHHISHLRQVFHRFQDVGFVIKVAKCQLFQTEIDFLGHHISVNGIEASRKE